MLLCIAVPGTLFLVRGACACTQRVLRYQLGPSFVQTFRLKRMSVFCELSCLITVAFLCSFSVEEPTFLRVIMSDYSSVFVCIFCIRTHKLKIWLLQRIISQKIFAIDWSHHVFLY